MLIAHISDTHITTHDDPDLPQSNARIQALTAFVKHINLMAEKPDLIIHTGDVTHGGEPEYYATVKAIMSVLDVPVYFALGNRDKADNLVAGLGDLGSASTIGKFLIYSVDQYPVRMIAMDTQNRGENIGTTCSERLDALDAMLKAEPNKPTALYMHHPPFEVTTSKYPFQFNDQLLADAFLDLITQHKQVVHMFCGHMHRSYRVDLPTCVATITPSLVPDNRLGDFDPAIRDKPLFELHRWNPDTGAFETSLHAVDGA
ncbi:metallophosphoesterase family protein [Magnetovibrio sp.]|uniref:metallophosphoesterase family protein n=1 Tax=Magnetovibrio sp. TaxID=2024836 RepID=UPI002F95D25D